MKVYDVEVYRDGRWWMIEVPEVDGLTQARRVAEIEDMARDLVATILDVPLSQVGVKITSLKIGDVDGLAVAEAARRAREEAEAAEERATVAMRQAVATLSRDATVRDVGEMLGVSHQRVSQLVKR